MRCQLEAAGRGGSRPPPRQPLSPTAHRSARAGKLPGSPHSTGSVPVRAFSCRWSVARDGRRCRPGRRVPRSGAVQPLTHSRCLRRRRGPWPAVSAAALPGGTPSQASAAVRHKARARPRVVWLPKGAVRSPPSHANRHTMQKRAPAQRSGMSCTHSAVTVLTPSRAHSTPLHAQTGRQPGVAASHQPASPRAAATSSQLLIPALKASSASRSAATPAQAGARAAAGGCGSGERGSSRQTLARGGGTAARRHRWRRKVAVATASVGCRWAAAAPLPSR